MNTPRIIIALVCFFTWQSHANEVMWTGKLVRYDFPGTTAYDAWAIWPASEHTTNPERLKDLLTGIHSKNREARIQHIALSRLFLKPDLQSDVMTYLQKQRTFRESPPPFGVNEWHFKNSGEIKKLVAEGLLRSAFVTSLNEALAPHKKKIDEAVMEKLFFTNDGDNITWHAIVWLRINALP